MAKVPKKLSAIICSSITEEEASTTIKKTQLITDFRFSKEETVYERLQRLALNAKKLHAEDELNHIDTKSPQGDIIEYLAEQKDKARRTFLLHGGSFPL